jgi:hypothetical protein
MVFPLSDEEATQLRERIDAELARARDGEGGNAKATEAVLAKSWLIAREHAVAGGRDLAADGAVSALQTLSSAKIRAGLLRAANDDAQPGGRLLTVVQRLEQIGEDYPLDGVVRATMRGPGGGPPETDPRSVNK